VVLVLVGLVAVLGVSTWKRHQRSQPPVPLSAAEKAGFCVGVLNGNGRLGEARIVSSRLRSEGFRVDETGNASRFDYPRTLVVDRGGNDRWAGEVAATLGGLPVIRQRKSGATCAIQVILGLDWSLEGQW
jgi:hypothetical protein